MKFKSLIFMGTWMVLAASMALGAGLATPIAVEPAAQSAAAQAFKAFGGTGMMGMPTTAQMKGATLGEPLSVKMVQLDELKGYKASSNSAPEALLHDLQTLVYPVKVAGGLHGEMVVGKSGGAWSARSFAGPSHLQGVENIRMAITRSAGIPASAMMLVRVPALNIEFVGYRDAAGLKLAPLHNVPSAGLVAGQLLPAQRVFELLVPLAVRHNGLPS